MNIRPLSDKVILSAIDDEKITKGGIIIPDSATEKPSKGKIVAIGSKCKEVKVGDIVFFESYATKQINNDDEKLLVLKEEDITAIIG